MCPALALRMCHRLNACGALAGTATLPKLKGAVIEYCVHGHFYRSEDDEKGRYGAWWVPLRRLVRQLGKEEMEERVAEFKAELARLESNAIARARSRGE